MPGRFDNIPLMPSVAREIIRGLFTEQSVWRKSAIDARVDQLHRSEGGIPGKQPLSGAVKKALQDLQTEGLIINRYGHWQLCECTDTLDNEQELAIDADSTDEFAALPTDQATFEAYDIVVEKEIGAGDESVYVFFNPNDRKLAALERRNSWECKVGKTTVADSLARIFSLRTALSHQPVIGLLIKTPDSSALEKALHAALRLTDAAVPDSPGVEWFMTSPACVEAWHECFLESLGALSESAATIAQKSPSSD